MSLAARRVSRAHQSTGGSGGGTPNLTKNILVSGLTRPWDMTFLSDGTMFFTQRIGRLHVREASGTVRQIVMLSDVVTGSEGGLLGVATHPNFASNRYIYMYLSSNISGSTDNRVVRWTLDAGYTTLSNRTDIVTGIQYTTGRHSGGRIKFGPDGYLWIGTGDVAVGTNPQNKMSLNAKVLRVDTDGNPAPGNAGAGFDPRVYTYGHRNVQGLLFRTGTGQAFNVEHGTYRDDEVNKLVPAGNYGYDPIPGYEESVPMTDFVKFPSAVGATWSSGNPTIATSGGTFLTGSQWKDWEGRAAVCVQKDRHLMILEMNAAGTSTLSVEQRFTTDNYRLRSAVQGPDGYLYIATDNSGGTDQIWQVVPS